MTMRILQVASEAFPLVKTGGLADVVGALSGALAARGHEVVLLLPCYPQTLRAALAKLSPRPTPMTPTRIGFS